MTTVPVSAVGSARTLPEKRRTRQTEPVSDEIRYQRPWALRLALLSGIQAQETTNQPGGIPTFSSNEAGLRRENIPRIDMQRGLTGRDRPDSSSEDLRIPIPPI